eukprot:scaffold3987_cov134-Cylindrotheca_fusiformis.AAC.1
MIRSRQHVPSPEEIELRQAVQSRPFPKRKKTPKKTTTITSSLITFVCTFLFLFIIGGWLSLTTSVLSKSNSSNINKEEELAKKKNEFIRKKGMTTTNNNNNKKNEKKLLFSISEASIDQVVLTLMNLAQLPTQELQNLLEGEEVDSTSTKTKNPFQLKKLQEGICPWTSPSSTSTTMETIPWLPPKTSPERSRILQSNENNKKTPPIVAIYYEHLSKAGGTSFCKLAQSNMDRKLIPRYYCMPSKPNNPDARVGSWSVQELEEYFLQKSHRLVSNEWEPFNLEYQQYFSPKHNENRVQLLFVTSIRNPINRLLSAFQFWGILHNERAKIKPTLEQWLSRYARRAKTWKILDGDFTANVGRFNFATWKFSGGTLPVSDMNLKAETLLTTTTTTTDAAALLQEHSLSEDEWKRPFETAIRTLSQFDLIIPMEELSNHSQPVTDMLGWKDFSQAHVVPSGTIVNNKASTSHLPSYEYDLLWQSNSLDMILYYWSLAVYLTRLHCSNVLVLQQ